MKKKLFVIALAVIGLTSCEKNLCGCYEPVKAEKKDYYGGPPFYLYSRTEYLITYRNDCGETKTEKVDKAYYDIWQAMPPICD